MGTHCATLAGCNLKGLNLANANLSGADLVKAILTNAVLTRAVLENAFLTAANLTGANLTGANLTGANLTGANLTGANLIGANLTGANLTGANLTGANLTGATWSNTVCPDGTNSSSDGGVCRATSQLTLAAPSVPVGIVGRSYSLQLAASGGTPKYHWSHTGGLPGGLTLNASTGLISGTPTSATYGVVVAVHVADSTSPTNLETTQVLTFYIALPSVPLITEFSPVSNTNNPTIVIAGTNFGKAFPTSDLNVPATSPYLEIFDCLGSSGCEPNTTNTPKWTSGYSPGGDLCQLTVKAWSNTEIALQFDSNPLCPFNTGQILGVLVWNTNDPSSNARRAT